MSKVYEEIYKIVQQIPRGRVLTYGIISQMIGGRMSAQGVGWALQALGKSKRKDADKTYDSDTVPWQRVVNAQGGISTHKVSTVAPGMQQHLLEGEGIIFNDECKLDLKKYFWYEGVKAHEEKTR